MTRPYRFGTALVAVAALAGALLASAGAAAPAAASEVSASASQELRVVTFNTDARGADYFRRAWDVIGPNADIVFVQEAKNVDIGAVLGTGWAVRQNTSTDAKQGSAVVVRRSITRDIGVLELVLGVDASHCDGGGILTRYISKVPVQLSNGRWLRVASLHMPPARCQTGPGSPYDRMADNVVQFANRTDRLTVLGADWNKVVDDDPNNIGGRTGLKPRGPDTGLRIDGFYVSQAISTCCLGKLDRIGDNDHRPVRMTVTVPAP